jgi:hypothetical protein
MSRLKRFVPLLVICAPSLLSLAIDLVLRGGGLVRLSTNAKLGYACQWAAVLAMWIGIIWTLARLAVIDGPRKRAAGGAFVAILAVVVVPILTWAYGVQVVYYSIFRTYIWRQTISVGFALRGSLAEWIGAWGRGVFLSFVFASAFAAGLAWAIRRNAAKIATTRPIAPIVAFAGAVFAFATDALPRTWVQAPDSSFIGGMIAFARDVATHAPRAGVTSRESVPVSPVAPRTRRNVILIMTESVRFDALCSSRKAAGCEAQFLDQTVPDRLGFAKLTSQTSGTLTACMILWTGLGPEADVRTAHTTPFLWEVARAAGYRTIYVTSQDMRSIDMGPYLRNGGMDVKVVGEDLGSRVESMQMGALDEHATAKMVEIARAETQPYFAVLQLANTHYPYRVDESLAPHRPHGFTTGDVPSLRNHYLDAVLLQERTIAEFYRAMKALPSWDDTLTIFLSDHGEQFREHGALFHLNSLFETEVHVPGWVAGGARSLSAEERANLERHLDRRVYTQDVHATILDALGVLEARPSLAHGDLMAGRSLLRPRDPVEPLMAMSTVSGVWVWDGPSYGVMAGETKAIRDETGRWQCWNLASDPLEEHPAPAEQCPELVRFGRERFP